MYSIINEYAFSEQLQEKEEDIQTLLEELQRVRAVAAENAEKLQQMELTNAEKAVSILDIKVLQQMELRLEESKETIRSLQSEKGENVKKLGKPLFNRFTIDNNYFPKSLTMEFYIKFL
jgi:hypothetical protein